MGSEAITLIYPTVGKHYSAWVCVCAPHLCVHTHTPVYMQRWTLRAGRVSQLAFHYWLHVKSYLSNGKTGYLRARILIARLCIPKCMCRAYTCKVSRDQLNKVPEGTAHGGSLKSFSRGRQCSFLTNFKPNGNSLHTLTGGFYPRNSQIISLSHT